MRLDEDTATVADAAREMRVMRRPFSWGEEKRIAVGVGRGHVNEGFEVFEG